MSCVSPCCHMLAVTSACLVVGWLSHSATAGVVSLMLLLYQCLWIMWLCGEAKEYLSCLYMYLNIFIIIFPSARPSQTHKKCVGALSTSKCVQWRNLKKWKLGSTYNIHNWIQNNIQEIKISFVYKTRRALYTNGFFWDRTYFFLSCGFCKSVN